MPRLQRTKRSNGSILYSVNLPLEFMEELGWEKGSDLSMEIKDIENKQVIIISKDEEELNEKEEE